MGVEKVAGREEREAAEMAWDSLIGDGEFREKTTARLRHLVDKSGCADVRQVTLEAVNT